MSEVLFDVQSALYAELAADLTLQGLLGNPVRLFDHVPPGAIFPYITFGQLQITPYDDKTESGFEQLVTLDIWSRYRGAREAKDIMQAAYNVLQHAALSLNDGVFISSLFHSAEVTPLDDGLTTHAALRFSVVTQSD